MKDLLVKLQAALIAFVLLVFSLPERLLSVGIKLLDSVVAQLGSLRGIAVLAGIVLLFLEILRKGELGILAYVLGQVKNVLGIVTGAVSSIGFKAGGLDTIIVVLLIILIMRKKV